MGKRRLPSPSELQNYVKSKGGSLPYNKVATLVGACRRKLLESATDHEIVVEEDKGKISNCRLKAWTQQNREWKLDTWIGDEKRIAYEATSDPEVKIGDKFAQWLS